MPKKLNALKLEVLVLRRPYMQTVFIVSLLLLAPTLCTAQTASPHSQSSFLPEHHLQLGQSECDNSGTAYARAYPATVPRIDRFTETGKTLHPITLNPQESANYRLQDFTVDPDGVAYVLLSGKKTSATRIVAVNPRCTCGKHIDLTLPHSIGQFTAGTIAHFASGRFLILGWGAETDTKAKRRFIPLALVFGSSGRFVSIVGGTISSQRNNPLWAGGSLNNMAGELKMSLSQPYGSNSVDIIPPKNSNEMIEISDTGKIEKIISVVPPGPTWHVGAFYIWGDRALMQYTQYRENDFHYLLASLPAGKTIKSWSRPHGGIKAGNSCRFVKNTLQTSGPSEQAAKGPKVTVEIRPNVFDAPVNIVKVNIGKRTVVPGVPISVKGNEWIGKLSVTVRNDSNKVLVYTSVGVTFPDTGSGTRNSPVLANDLKAGVLPAPVRHTSDGKPINVAGIPQIEVKPGQEIILKQRYGVKVQKDILAMRGMIIDDIHTVALSPVVSYFLDGTSWAWGSFFTVNSTSGKQRNISADQFYGRDTHASLK